MGDRHDPGIRLVGRFRRLGDLADSLVWRQQKSRLAPPATAHFETLQIDGPQITGAWLDRMATMKPLRQLMIGGGRVSDEAIARLHRSLPEVQIYVNGRPR